MQYYLKRYTFLYLALVGRNASNLQPLAPLEDTHTANISASFEKPESTESTSPSAGGSGLYLVFHQAGWVLCFSLNRGLDRSLLSSSEFHTCTLLFGLDFVFVFSFFFFFNYKTFTLFLKAAAPILETCSCKTFAMVCCVFRGFVVLLRLFMSGVSAEGKKCCLCVASDRS